MTPRTILLPVLFVVATGVAHAQTGVPPEALEYPIAGVSLMMDTSTIHRKLLTQGFKRVDGDGRVIEAPPVDGKAAMYVRGVTPGSNQGETLTITDVVLSRGRDDSIKRHYRELSYRYIRPRIIGAGRGGWSGNPDRSWFVPLFDLVCAHKARLNANQSCNRHDAVLNTGSLAMPAGLQLDAFDTQVYLRRELN